VDSFTSQTKLKKLAIVGRPNVGKSALFNRLCKRRLAIVDDMEGVTRDRLYCPTDFFGTPFLIIDSGGIDPLSNDQFKKDIMDQSVQAIEEADAIILVVDARVGPTDLDHMVARILLKYNKPLVLAVNKIDNDEQEILLHQFHTLGITKMFAVSAIQGYQIAELIEPLVPALTPTQEDAKGAGSVRVSVIGRANVGKSTLLNSLLDERRCLVSPIAGTTRDSVDIPFEYQGREYMLIDTAGIRRKKSEKEVVEKFAAMRTQKALERCHVALLLLDVRDGLTTQDKLIAKEIEKAGKGCVVLLNKWDLVKGMRMEHAIKQLKDESPFLAHCPILCLSAKLGRNLDQILPLAETVYQALERKVSTHQLNTFVENAIMQSHPPMIQGRRLRIYYLTQMTNFPPRFVLFVNTPALMTQSYKRYLVNQLRKQYQFTGAPLVMHLRGKKRKEAGANQLASK
jgi:GTPase